MNKLLDFLYNHVSFILFVVLEIIGFVLLVNKNDLQQSVAFRIGMNMSAQCYKVTTGITDYFGLKTVNEHLAMENAELRNRISALEEHAVEQLTDSAATGKLCGNLKYITAKVVYNSVYDIQNYIIVNKGSKDGVEQDMGVIAPQGVVGVVQRVSENYAVVLPLINPDQVVSAKIKKSSQLGSIIWDGKSPRTTKLEEIPGHVNPTAGDTVVTSGYSAIFPEGMTIGTIEKAVQYEHTMFCDVEVNLAVDFQSLTYVTITAYKNKSEFNDLQKKVKHEK